jgi:flagellar motor protein MotB
MSGSPVHAAPPSGDATVTLSADGDTMNHVLYFLWQSGALREAGTSTSLVRAALEDATEPGEKESILSKLAFDFIVAHGVYSWVPPPVRDALFALASGRLARNGILYVSYNVLPGCRVRQAAWDVLHHHVDRIEDKLGQGVIQIPTLETMHANLKEGLAGIKDLGDIAAQVPIEITPEGLQIEIIDKDKLAFFDLNNAIIKPVMQRVLNLVANEIKEAPNKIVIAGHTDSRGYHNDSYYSNWELSSARALNTRRAMEDAGIVGERFTQVVGYADRKLRIPSDPLAPENRRISILILRGDKHAKKAETAPEEMKDATKSAAGHGAHDSAPGPTAKPAQAQEPLNAHTQEKLEVIERLAEHTQEKLEKTNPAKPKKSTN